MSEDNQGHTLDFKDTRLFDESVELNSRAKAEQEALNKARGADKRKKHEATQPEIVDAERPVQEAVEELNRKALELTDRLGSSGHVSVEDGVILRIPGKSGVDKGNTYITVSLSEEERSFSVVISPNAREPEDWVRILDYDHTITGEGSHEWRKVECGKTKGDLYNGTPDIYKYDRLLTRALVITSDNNT